MGKKTVKKSAYAVKTRTKINSQKLESRDFWRICNSVLNRNKSSIPPLFNHLGVLASSKDKADLFAKTFSENSTLNDSVHPLPEFPMRTELSLESLFISLQ